MIKTTAMRSIIALGVILSLSVGGSSNSTALAGTITSPVPKSTKDMVKFTKGNKWVYNITETSSVNNSIDSAKTTNYTSTTVITSATRNKSATYSTTTTRAGTPIVDTTNYFDAKGNLLVDVPAINMTGTMVYPAQIAIGATWQAPIPFVKGAKVTSKITSTNETYTGPAGTFNNLVRIDLSSNSHVTMMGVTMTIKETGYQLISPVIGSSVYETQSVTTYMGTDATTTGTTKVLQPGYIAK